MVCAECKLAGAFNTAGRIRIDYPEFADQMFEAARIHHAQCAGHGQCDCHHLVGDNYVNKQLVDFDELGNGVPHGASETEGSAGGGPDQPE